MIRRTLRHPLAAPLLVGALLRIVSALSGFGYFAADDVKYVIDPAWIWVEQPDAPYPSEIRSPLLAHVFWLLFEVARSIGLGTPVASLRFAGLCMGVFSLVAVPAVHRLAVLHFDTRTARTAAWLVAAQALMPMLSTLALLSVAALPCVAIGFAAAAEAQGRGSIRWGILAGFAFAVASMFRFQAGLFFIGLLVFWSSRRRVYTLGLLLGGAGGAMLQGLWDQYSRGEWFGSLLAYVRYNIESSSNFGTAPWFTYLLFFVALTLPITPWVLLPLWRAARSAPLVSIPLGLFVLVHSLIPHKEERFMFAAFAPFLVLLAQGMQPLPRRVAFAFWVVNSMALLAATLSDGNRSMASPLLDAGETEEITEVVAVGRFYAPRIYLNRRLSVHEVRRDALQKTLAKGIVPLNGVVRFLFIGEPPKRARMRIEQAGFRCTDGGRFQGDLVDQLLLAINPTGNKRRRARHALDCRRSPG